MRTVGTLLLVIAFLGGSARSTWAGEGHLPAAQAIGDFLVETAAREDGAWSWRQYEGPGPAAHGDDRHRPVSLYVGTTGVGWFLLNLGLATKEKRYLVAAKGAGRHLLRTASKVGKTGLEWKATQDRRGRSAVDGDGLGLYVGNAGIGLFLQHLHEATGERAFSGGARRAFGRILAEAETGPAGVYWPGKALDLISGEAGIGLALLEMGRLTAEKRYRKVTPRVANWLVAQGQGTPRTYRWERRGWFDPNLSHGAAGIALFLARTGDAEPGRVARRAATWVRSRARSCGEGCLLWTYYGGSPPAKRRDWVMNTWCHGAPGTIRLFLALAKGPDGKPHLEAAKEAGNGIRHEMGMQDGGAPRYMNPTYCCGAAGCLDAFLDLYVVTGEKRWLEAAQAVAAEMVAGFGEVGGHKVHASYDAADRAAKKHPYAATGFMQGNAGIGHALLRLALLEGGRGDVPVPLPDAPLRPGS